MHDPLLRSSNLCQSLQVRREFHEACPAEALLLLLLLVLFMFLKVSNDAAALVTFRVGLKLAHFMFQFRLPSDLAGDVGHARRLARRYIFPRNLYTLLCIAQSNRARRAHSSMHWRAGSFHIVEVWQVSTLSMFVSVAIRRLPMLLSPSPALSFTAQVAS